jgi:hypothetical protein
MLLTLHWRRGGRLATFYKNGEAQELAGRLATSEREMGERMDHEQAQVVTVVFAWELAAARLSSQ